MKSFIEAQFPVSKLSKESYKERKANYSQTLTGLGKWWGRKPLILVRATILGLLMPATSNPKKDREVFLKILIMDSEGLWRRKNKPIAVADLYEALADEDRGHYFEAGARGYKFKREVTPAEKEALQRKVFDTYTYDEKLELCCRPEHLEGPSEDAWNEINGHLGTSANSISELVQQLGRQLYGHTPRVGDAFTGGGSVPFEAARIGCDAFGSDLNPVAALLTWSSLNIVGGGEEIATQVAEAQQVVYDAVDEQISQWGIEHNEEGWRADAFLYCTETRCPECGWMVPMAPSWVVGEKTRTIAQLVPEKGNNRFRIDILSGATDAQMKAARKGTVVDSELTCANPSCGVSTPISTIRGDRRVETGNITNLRQWDKNDIVSRPDDIFQERLYCIRWVETYYQNENDEQPKTRKWYRSVSEPDLQREQKVLNLLHERFKNWQKKGYIPSGIIEPGEKTDEPIRTRGWNCWHHLFTPRQLLVHGLLSECADKSLNAKIEKAAALLGVGRCADWDSRLCRWDSSAANEKVAQTFSNQALNTMLTYAGKGFTALENSWFLKISTPSTISPASVYVSDTRVLKAQADLWVTDPPYADAINYHELTEFFLAWYGKLLVNLFPQWYADTKRALAVVGADEGFRRSMVDCYRNLAENMPDNGMQVVMFTHQNAGVWADLALILWASGLQVTSAWTLATETDIALKKGNYVQGTVLLVLRKRQSNEIGFLDEITHDIKPEVERQLQSMLDIEDKDDPNFTDSDYQLAAYAAALRVLTSYKQIEDLDVERELSRPRRRGDKSPIETMIESGVKIASNFLIPKILHDDEITRRDIWRNFSAEEKFYIKGLEIESHGDYRQGVYQEFAKGFGLREYTNMLESGRANETRLKTASEFRRRELGAQGFGSTLTRHVLFAISQTCGSEEVSQGLRWLKEEIPGDYWQQKQTILALLRYFAKLPIEHWRKDAECAQLLAGTVENDTV